MTFKSILYENDADCAKNAPREAPEYFRDLNLDQIVDAITASKQDYDLKPFFHDSLKTTGAIHYRHEVMRDLEDSTVLGCIRSFATSIQSMRQSIAAATKLHYKYQKERWFLHAVEIYCAAVRELANGLSGATISSAGLLGFLEYLTHYVESDRFCLLAAEATLLREDLAAIQYCILVRNTGFQVRKYDAELDYSDEVTATFERFREGAVKDYLAHFPARVEMNHIDAKVLDFVALLFDEQFSRLDEFFEEHQEFADPVLTTFDREIQFYLAYLDYMDTLERSGLQFCYPRISEAGKELHDNGAFDLALAAKLVATNTPIVCNDLDLTGRERIFIVSGPNQGGKTTFARTFGQLHHLASIGCPVPGRNAQLFLFDSMFTHFEKEETIENLRGKLQDDLIRLRDILDRATPRSIVIINEIFNSTSLKDATFLARQVLRKIIDLDALCVCVTFLDELTSLSEKVVSLVSTVAPDDPATRTYKVVRRPADGRAYALSIAEKYGVTYECLKERIRF